MTGPELYEELLKYMSHDGLCTEQRENETVERSRSDDYCHYPLVCSCGLDDLLEELHEVLRNAEGDSA